MSTLIDPPITNHSIISKTFQNAVLLGTVKDEVESFLGIPYAVPPINHLRFTAPQPIQLNGTIDARTFGKSCIQDVYIPLFSPKDEETSEDCLTLNVYSPVGAKDLPVMVWIHGGYFSMGTANSPLYDGRRIVNNDFVFVSLNYRLGAFGFMGSKEIQQEGDLNVGFLDQKLALKWVKENIGAFGGDGEQITLAGESAGAWSVANFLLTDQGNQDLFQRAILLSGGPRLYHPNLQVAQKGFDKVIENSGCTQSLDCLRKLSAFELRDAAKEYGRFGLIRDDNVPNTISSLKEGQFSKVPILVHLNQDEGTMFAYHVKTRQNFLDFVNETASFFSKEAKTAVNENYQKTPFESASLFFADQQFICPSKLLSTLYSEAGVPVYQGIFKHINVLKIPYPLGAYHSSELVHFFNSEQGVDPSEQAFSQSFRAKMLAFITTGNPGWESSGESRFDYESEEMQENSSECDDLYEYNQEAADSTDGEIEIFDIAKNIAPLFQQ